MFYVLTIIMIFMLDYASKFYILEHFSYGQVKEITSFFNLIYVKNLGVSFSLFYNNHKIGPFIIGLLAIIIILFLFKLFFKASNIKSKFALCWVLGGAIGNVFDRFYYKGVIDFLDFHFFGYHWPSFNVADIAIVCGVLSFYFFERK